MRSYISQLTVAVIAVILWGAVSLTVHAQHTVQPVFVDKKFNQRETATQTITLHNPTDVTVRVYATVNAIADELSGTLVEFLPRSQVDNRNTATSWIEVERGRITIPPGESNDVTVRFSIHHQAVPGIYRVRLGFATGANRTQAEQRSLQGDVPGTTIRIEIEDARTSFLQVHDFSLDRFILDGRTEYIRFTIINPSESELVPAGEIVFYNMRGSEVYSLPINQDNHTIEAGGKHTFSEVIPQIASVGRHRALLSVRYGDGQHAQINDTVFFYNFTVVALLFIFIGIVVATVLLSYVIHRRVAVIDDNESVAVFVRNKATSTQSDDDINLSST